MNTTEQEIRTLRKRAKTWLAIFAYGCARGPNYFKVFSQRLWSICEPAFKSEVLRETMGNVLPKIPDEEDIAAVKKTMVSKLTPSKIERRILNAPKMLSEMTLAKSKPKSFTLGRLIFVWAALTHQSRSDFMIKVTPSINRIFNRWYKATGCIGLTDEECGAHPKESARFISDFLRVLIQATPEENLAQFIKDGIHALSDVIKAPGLDKTVNKLLRQSCRIITKETAGEIYTALKANPNARDKIAVPELQALVLREKAKLGWISRDNEEEVLNTLRENLNPKLKRAVGKRNEIIKGSVEIAARRSLYDNLLTALKGELKPRFIGSIIRFLKNTVHVKSKWEFGTPSSNIENANSVQSWLFRR